MTEYGRTWNEDQTAAGYHEQDWGPEPTADSEVIGVYASGIEVRLHEGTGTGLAEFEIEWPGGSKVTVLNEATVLAYLAMEGDAEVVPD
jgi:hypothetical protein